jgi:hypothetical protein
MPDPEIAFARHAFCLASFERFFNRAILEANRPSDISESRHVVERHRGGTHVEHEIDRGIDDGRPLFRG